MPANIIKSFSEKSGKSTEEVEKLYKGAKNTVIKQYKLTEEDEKFYPLVTGILKKMCNIKDSICLCDSCRTIIDVEDKYCANCGSKLQLMDYTPGGIKQWQIDGSRLKPDAIKKNLDKDKDKEVWIGENEYIIKGSDDIYRIMSGGYIVQANRDFYKLIKLSKVYKNE
jgi:hypothetical protein